MHSQVVLLVLVVLVNYIHGAGLGSVEEGDEKSSLVSQLSRQKRAFIVRSTTYTTTTVTSTMSTASVCFLKNYKCSGGRRRRNIIDSPLNNEQAEVLQNVPSQFRDLVKRTADDHLLDLQGLTNIKFFPSKVVEEEEDVREKREAEDDEEEQQIVEEEKSDRQGKFLFFQGVTIVQTSTTSTTTTTTSTIGTIGITGKTSECAGTSISTYFSACG